MSKTVYIKAVMIVFFLLILSRIRSIIAGSANLEIIVSSVVEFVFLVWGVLVLRLKR